MKKSTLSIALAAGIAGSAMASDMQKADIRVIEDSKVGSFDHIYYNISTGEYIVTQALNGQTTAVDAGASQLIWETQQLVHQCDGINGHGGEDDQVNGLAGGDDIPQGELFVNGSEWATMGDVPIDTVVDCVDFAYWSAHADTDLDEDGNADGIPGFGITLVWNDSDNGFGIDISTRVPVVQVTFGGLPGIVDNPGFLAGHFFTVDLSGGGEFVLGDSDGDLQGAAVGGVTIEGNPTGEPGHDRNFDGNDDADIDGDGFFDFSRGMIFIQPGTFDFDGDEILDGDVADQATTALNMGTPRGWTMAEDGLGGWEIDVDDTVEAYARGAQTGTAVYFPDGSFQGNFGFVDAPRCDVADHMPYFSISAALYSPGEVSCPADIDGNGELDFFDVGDFLANYAAGVDYNEDGVVDFFDVGDFLADFGAGCP